MRPESGTFRRMGDEVHRQFGGAPIDIKRSGVGGAHLERVHVGVGDPQGVAFRKVIVEIEGDVGEVAHHGRDVPGVVHAGRAVPIIRTAVGEGVC